MLEVLVQEHHLPVVRACRVVRLSRAAFYRPPISPTRADAAVIAALTAVVADHGRWGFWKCFDRLRLQGHPWNHKRVHRVYPSVAAQFATADETSRAASPATTARDAAAAE